MQIENLESRVLFSVVGSLDHTFGAAGQIITSANDNNELIVVQKNGAFIVGGSSIDSNLTDHGFLERFHSDGKIDKSFGAQGRLELTSMFDVLSLTLTPDNKIVIIGAQPVGNDLLARFNSNGKPDSHFGTAGITTLPANLESPKVKIEGNESLVVGADLNLSPGTIIGDGPPDVVGEIIHYTKAGVLDTHFGTSGTVQTQLGAGHEIGDFEAAANGKIEAFFFITSQLSTRESGNLERFNPNGSLDPAFQQDTAISIPYPYSYRFLPTGDFFTLLPGVNGGMDAVAYTFNGVPDFHFGIRGSAPTVPLPANDYGLPQSANTDRTVVEAGDKLLLVEYGTTASSTPYIALGGLTARGAIDKTFGKTGVVEVTPAGQVTTVATDGSRVIFLETINGVQSIVAYKI
jgi:uncharacterized delta-60 repeat protein